MAESLHNAAEFIGKHKLVLGLGGGAIVLWLLLRGGSSSASSSGGGNFAQIAQLQAAQNIQMAQLQAQQNTAALSAQVQQNQNTDALQAHQDDLAASIAATAYSANVENTKTNAQAALYHDLLLRVNRNSLQLCTSREFGFASHRALRSRKLQDDRRERTCFDSRAGEHWLF